MGGGDLNMKKSWHPLLMKNQEMVWLKEKEALEEKKKLDQLRKEKEEERQLQELQRMQEEQTGRKRQEKLEWMYATPATGSNANPNDLEDYLLGKKRVDKILTGDENAKVGASHKNFIAVQNANSIRDVAAKIREDPLLAIKQQEQAAYEALMKNPLRLKELQEKTGIKTKKDKRSKKDKKDKRDKGKERRRYDDDYHDDRHRHRSRRSISRSRSRSPDYYRSSRRRSESPRRYSPPRDRSWSRERDNRRRSRSRGRDYGPRRRSSSRSDSRDGYGRRDVKRRRVSEEGDESRRRRSRSPFNWNTDYTDRRHSGAPVHKRSSSPPSSNNYKESEPPRNGYARPPPPARPSNGNSNDAEDRAARLAAMSSNATSMTSERKERLTALLAEEKAELEAEERRRAKSKGIGSFLSAEQKKVFGGEGGLEDRIRRGRGGLVAEAD